MPYDRSEYVIGIGKSIAFADTLGGTYTTIYGTTDIQLPERELGTTELTNDSTPDFHKDYIPSLYEPGTIPFKYKYSKTQFTAVETVFQLANTASTRASATKFWKITLPDGSVGIQKGFLVKNGLPVEIEDVPEVEAEIQCVGKMSWTAGT